jgi:hypothetical protein
MTKITVHNSFRPEPLEGKDANLVLKLGCDILEKLNLKYWISAGTLLGIYRDYNFIPHDTDIDVEILLDYQCNWHLIRENFEKNEFLLIRSMFNNEIPVQLAFNYVHENIIFDIYFFRQNETELYSNTDCGTLYYPKNKFNNLTSIKFNGRDYPCPEPKWYCEFRYGENWNIKTSSKQSWQKDATNLR